MGDYPPNSYLSKNKTEEETKEERKLEPVVTHDVQVRKKGAFQKFANAFIAEDLQSVKSYVWSELVIPGIKKMIVSGIDMLLNGKGSSNKKENRVTSISYRDYYEKENNRREGMYRNNYLDFEDIVFEDRGDAEYVLDQMWDILKQFRVVRVSDMFELSKVAGPYTGNNYGWTDLSIAKVVPCRGGYMIKMPRAIPIDRV